MIQVVIFYIFWYGIMQNFFRVKKTYASVRDREFRQSIRVIPKASWILLAGGILALAGILFWALTGDMVTTTAINGIYHPGSSEYGELICFPNISSGKQIESGMEINVYLPAYDQTVYGHMIGEVTFVDDYVASEEEMTELLGDESLVQLFYKNAPVVTVICALKKDPDSANGYYWTLQAGQERNIADGTFMTAYVTIDRENAVSFLLK